ANRNAATPIDRLYLSIAMQRLGDSKTATEYRWRLAESLSKYEADADDHNLPRMHWFAIEPLVVDSPQRAIGLAKASKIPLLSRHIARRLTAEGKLDELVAAIGESGSAQRELLYGMREGMDGRDGLKAPATWQSVYAKLREQGGEPARTALHLSVKFGDEVATRALLETVKKRDADLGDRTQALRGLAERKRAELKKELVGLLDDQAIRKDAIRAMAAYDDEELARSLLSRYDDLSTDEKLESVITLSTRSKFGRALTDSIKSGAIPRRDIPAYVARALQRVVGNGFLEVWGPIEASGGDKQALFDKYRKLLTEERLADADLSHGRLLFNRTCQACHRLYGEGGRIGPEITGANRTNLDYLLGNILTPSADIQDSYRMELVLTDDGRMFSGIPSGEDRWQLSLRIANQDEPVKIPKSQIEDRETAKTSMMPEGLLTTLKDDEVIDLIGYLRHLEQVPLPSLSER
ncbi:MAG: c-type cytochrome, partial [Planctomycetota bacterium]